MTIRYSEAKRAIGWGLVCGRIGMLCGVLLGMGVLAFPASGNSTGIAGKAGAPGDPLFGQSRTCEQCHNTPPANPVLGTLKVEVPAEVDANERVDITVVFDGDEIAVWGFNLIALVDEEAGEPVGTLGAGSGSQILPSTVLWEYLSHTLAGTANRVDQVFPGWEVQWRAPAQGTTVRFYATFNAADGQGFPNPGQAGDQIFTAEAVVTVVPEPGLAGAAAVSLAALAALRRRRRV